ncbi:MAG: ISKra4 family transposase, partial [Syntrophales bacterium LBB04]|nr:ISKra4 family transposase [Syntrophales bacterium LBB04]
MRDRDKQGHVDLEALEFHLRSSMHCVGSRLLERLVNCDGGDYRGTTLRSEKGEVFEFKEYRDKEVLTVLGPVVVQRAYYYDKDGGGGYCPKDVALDIAETSFSPGVRRIMAKAGAYRPFGLGQEDIREMAGIEVNSKAIERISHQLGEEVEGFYRREGSQFLSGKVVPLQPVTTMYICM